MPAERRDHRDWDIEDVLVRLGLEDHGRRGGRWTEVRCPFHDDRNRSAGYSASLNIFRCHTCGAKGNPVSLVMQQLGLSMADAVAWLDEGGTSVRREPEVSRWRRV